MAVSDTLINTLFDGRYRVIRKLGAGGMADVYLAEDDELGRRVAIKILNDRHAADEQFVERFRREAKNAAGLSHPNIVSIYDRGEAEGTYYIAMEYLDGRTLKELVVSRERLPVGEAIAHARQVLAAIRFAHRKGIVHRDIKPHNVLIDSDGRLKVTDFGIARAGVSQMTEAGSIIGTAQYLSPEQARGGTIDHRSDIYSAGIVLYELLTGAVPFTGDTPVEIAMKHLSEVPEPPSAKRPEIPEALDQTVLRALAKDPEDRFQTAEEMDAELGRVAAGLAVSPETAEAATAVLAGAGISDAPTSVVRRPAATAPPQTPYRSTRGYYYEPPPPRRRPWWPWLLALLLLVGAGVAGWLAYGKIEEAINANAQVAVPNLVGVEEVQAVAKIREKGLEPQIRRLAHEETPPGIVFDQSPSAGDRTAKGNDVFISVSTGKPKTTVPNVVGRSSTDAVSAIVAATLRHKLTERTSDEPVGVVIEQKPKAGAKVAEDTIVTIVISKGQEQVTVPPVTGIPFENARGELQGAGFNVQRRDVASSEAPGIVVDQDPSGNEVLVKGGTVTVFVSSGPSEATVPDVLGFSEASATSTLRGAGFKATVRKQATADETDNGIVLDQQPFGGTDAKRGSAVTIVVGEFTPEELPGE